MSTWKNVQGSQRYKYRSRTINAYCSCVYKWSTIKMRLPRESSTRHTVIVDFFVSR